MWLHFCDVAGKNGYSIITTFHFQWSVRVSQVHVVTNRITPIFQIINQLRASPVELEQNLEFGGQPNYCRKKNESVKVNKFHLNYASYLSPQNEDTFTFPFIKQKKNLHIGKLNCSIHQWYLNCDLFVVQSRHDRRTANRQLPQSCFFTGF